MSIPRWSQSLQAYHVSGVGSRAINRPLAGASSMVHRHSSSVPSPSYSSSSPSPAPPSSSSLYRPSPPLPPDATSAGALTIIPPFEPRRTFILPSTLPSWYVGHMHRALRSLPALLARYPPPLVIEVRDARIPLSSINPAFEKIMRDTYGDDRRSGWQSRRLIVYTKRDLIDQRLQAPLREGLLEEASQMNGSGVSAAGEILFADTRSDIDIRQVLKWVKRQAGKIANHPPAKVTMTRGLAKTQRSLSGAFKHTPTPDHGIRVVILGMPNVGKSSLLNALRRVGTGKRKAASTAPQPGHTRKLTGTVRITTDFHKNAYQLQLDQSKATDSKVVATAGNQPKLSHPPIYVYDTPGVMVPYLGRGKEAAERGVKLAIAAGMKSSLFDTQGLADYLLFRLNLRYAWNLKRWHQSQRARSASPSLAPQPIYLTHLPMPSTATQSLDQKDIPVPTNSVTSLLQWAALKAPGTLLKKGERDLDRTAEFILMRWREGKLGIQAGELDLGVGEEEISEGAVEGISREGETLREKVRRVVAEYFARRREYREGDEALIPLRAPPELSELTDIDGINTATSLDVRPTASQLPSTSSHSSLPTQELQVRLGQEVSTNQFRKAAKKTALRQQRDRLRAKGVLMGRKETSLNTPEGRLKRASDVHRRWLMREGKLGKRARAQILHSDKMKSLARNPKGVGRRSKRK